MNIDVLFEDDTLWLTQKVMAELFEVNVPEISKHLKNIFKSNELEEKSVVSILETAAKDGKNYKTKYFLQHPDLHRWDRLSFNKRIR